MHIAIVNAVFKLSLSGDSAKVADMHEEARERSVKWALRCSKKSHRSCGQTNLGEYDIMWDHGPRALCRV